MDGRPWRRPVTVFTAAVKLRIIEAHLPPFVEGFVSGTNYAVSFVLLQVFGLVLATKQPATTAAAFARIIRDNRGLQRSSKLTDYVARITSTQLAAAIGNVAAVTVGCVLFELLWKLLFRESYLPELSATHVYDTLDPFASATALYAIETGVILWLAASPPEAGWRTRRSITGWRKRWRNILSPPVGAISLPAKQRDWFATTSVAGRPASCSVIFWVFAPEVGAFFGLPIDIRHVTLNSGTLALAAARFGTASLGHRWFYHAVSGIAVIFVLNLFVSFTIAAFVALRAYDVRPREQLSILRFLVQHAIRSPLRFVVPAFGTETPEPAQNEAAS